MKNKTNTESKLEVFDLYRPTGHVVLKTNRKTILVDTGAHVCVARTPTFQFMGEKIRAVSNYYGANMDLLSEYVEEHLDVLMGTPVLEKYNFLIDGFEGKITFSTTQIAPHVRKVVPLKEFMGGVPIVHAIINRVEGDYFVDTGAVRTYLLNDVVQGAQIVGSAVDFFPGEGRFETPVYEVGANIQGEEICMTAGANLPPGLTGGLTAAGVKGLIGMDLLGKYKLEFDLRHSQLLLVDKSTLVS